MSGYYEVKMTSNGQYMFNLKGDNHEPVLTSSETYTTKQSALTGIASVKTNAPLDNRYERFPDVAGKHRFRLKAANGEIIGKSEGYDTAYNRDRGVDWVKTNAPGAPVYDRTA